MISKRVVTKQKRWIHLQFSTPPKLNYMAMAGWDTTQRMDGLDGVMILAAISKMADGMQDNLQGQRAILKPQLPKKSYRALKHVVTSAYVVTNGTERYENIPYTVH